MKTLAELRQRLESRADIRFTSGDRQLTIHAKDENGFDITVIDEQSRVTVYFEGWHEHFETMEEALQCVGFGLSGECRVKVDRRGSTTYRWTLQYRDGEDWRFESSTSVIFCPFWKTRSTSYLQNHYISDPE